MNGYGHVVAMRTDGTEVWNAPSGLATTAQADASPIGLVPRGQRFARLLAKADSMRPPDDRSQERPYRPVLRYYRKAAHLLGTVCSALSSHTDG